MYLDSVALFTGHCASFTVWCETCDVCSTFYAVAG